MLFWTIIFVIIVCILAKYIESANFKGKSGEKMVAERLEILDGDKYIINNIMINDNGKSRQIDHIAITEYGVFVIETKNYNGDIYGKETIINCKQCLEEMGYKNAPKTKIHYCAKSKLNDI